MPIRCHSWECPACAKTNRRKLLRRLRYASPNLFATLTTSERTAKTPEEAFTRANAAVPVLLKRWRRRFPAQPLEYFLVWELTKRGWPHAHILLRAPRVAKRWLSRQWLELTGCYIVDIQVVGSNERAATYLAKYLSKAPAVPAGHRRWRRSAGFFHTALEPPAHLMKIVGKWERQPRPAIVQALFWLRNGLALDLRDPDIPRASVNPVKWATQISSGLYDSMVRSAPAWALPEQGSGFY